MFENSQSILKVSDVLSNFWNSVKYPLGCHQQCHIMPVGNHYTLEINRHGIEGTNGLHEGVCARNMQRV